MRKSVVQGNRFVIGGWIFVSSLFLLSGGCSVAEPKAAANTALSNPAANTALATNTEPPVKGAVIPIEPNGPADTVRVFYKHLREKKFREAMFLTNLRRAFEGLTDAELQDFSLDFETLAGQIPAEIEINGEIVTGDKASVTANFPDPEAENRKEVKRINLRKGGDVWTIQTVDDEAAKRIFKEGKQYFYNLRIETHEREAKKMLERVGKAQYANTLKNGGAIADMNSLVAAGLLPEDIKTSDSTGYIYAINIVPEKSTYYATATPATYGKSGKLSFIMKIDARGIANVTSKDNGGKVLAN